MIIFILGDFYYYFIQQLCVYCVNFFVTGASDTGRFKGYSTWPSSTSHRLPGVSTLNQLKPMALIEYM